MYGINKLVFALFNPFMIGLFIFVAALFIRRVRRALIAIGVLWMWLWSSGIAGRIVALPLEREWPVVAAEDQPTADAIVLLGGGISPQREGFPTPDMKQSADRAWYAAKLYNRCNAWARQEDAACDECVAHETFCAHVSEVCTRH